MKLNYTCKDKRGVIQKGVIEAPDETAATKMLRGILPAFPHRESPAVPPRLHLGYNCSTTYPDAS